MNKKYIFWDVLCRLPPSLRIRLFLLLPMLGLAGVLEILSLASIIPLGTSALDPEKANYWASQLGLINFNHQMLLVFFVFITLVLFVFKSIYIFFVTRYALNTAAYGRSFFQKELFAKYLRVPYLFHLSSNSSDFLRNITTECNYLDARFLTPILVLLAEFFPLIFIICFLMFVNPIGLVVATLIFLFSGILIVRLSSIKLRSYGSAQLESDGKMIKLMQQTFHSIKEVYLYEKNMMLTNKMTALANKSAECISRAALLNQVPRFVFEINTLMAVFVIGYISIQNGADTRQAAVELGVFLAAVFKLLPSSSKIVSHLQALSHSRSTVLNILNQLNLASDHKYAESFEEELKIKKFESLEVVDLSFSYKNGPLLFDKYSFTIKKGQVVGIIGETGSGKTSLINVLLGLVPFDSGSIMINGYEVDIIKREWNTLIGYVPQDIYILDETIANNLSFFEVPDESKVYEVLEKVGMLQFVLSLDKGIHTLLGEHGSRLSGGQKQRIAIARALYRNPELLIFDEATSALDNQTESLITESIDSLRTDKTIIIVAHRLSSLAYCDKIIHLNGKCEMKELSGEEFRSSQLL